MSRFFLRALSAATVLLGGCGSDPAKPVWAQAQPRTIAVKMQADARLNTDAGGHSLALVARIYMLRQNATFERGPYDSFLSPQKEQQLLGSDLIEVKEVLLVPGQHYEVLEKVSRDANFIGVVGLFRTPAPQRWRLAFAAGQAEQSGITIGAHACALSVGADRLPACP
ncbi:type VI secretion system protein VasD [Oxalobacteraceae bacterium GrIS 1.11]